MRHYPNPWHPNPIEGTEFEHDGKTYVLISNPSACQNAILSGKAILVDVGEELLMYALPKETPA